MAEPHRPRPDGSASAGPLPVEEVEARAARLGITPERVLEEYRRIAFSNMRHLVEWGPGENGMTVKPSKDLDEADAAAVAEIVAAAKGGKIYRIKLHDKRPVLDAIARHLNLLPQFEPEAAEDEPTEDEVKRARERFILELDRLAAEEAQGSGGPEPRQI
jgi:hypothetical protein